jgi:hypothetical protein
VASNYSVTHMAALAGGEVALAGLGPEDLSSGGVSDWRIQTYGPTDTATWNTSLGYAKGHGFGGGPNRFCTAVTLADAPSSTVHCFHAATGAAAGTLPLVGVVDTTQMAATSTGTILVGGKVVAGKPGWLHIQPFGTTSIVSHWTWPEPTGWKPVAVSVAPDDGVWVLATLGGKSWLSRRLPGVTGAVTVDVTALAPVSIAAQADGGCAVVGAISGTNNVTAKVRSFDKAGAQIAALDVVLPTNVTGIRIAEVRAGDFLLSGTKSAIGYLWYVSVSGTLQWSMTTESHEQKASFLELLKTPGGIVARGLSSASVPWVARLRAGGRLACDCTAMEQCSDGRACQSWRCSIGSCKSQLLVDGQMCLESGICNSSGTCQITSCGNGLCGAGEDWVTCPEDCAIAGVGCKDKCGSAIGPVTDCGAACSCASDCAKAGNCCADKWQYCPAQ